MSEKKYARYIEKVEVTEPLGAEIFFYFVCEKNSLVAKMDARSQVEVEQTMGSSHRYGKDSYF